MRTTIKTLFISSMVLLLGACQTTKPKDEIFNKGGPTILEIVNELVNSKADPILRKSHYGRSYGDNLTGYTRTQANELNNLFPVIDNPRLNVYIFPHITERGDPIPGYTTAFYLFTHSGQFALPGEFHKERRIPAELGAAVPKQRYKFLKRVLGQ